MSSVSLVFSGPYTPPAGSAVGLTFSLNQGGSTTTGKVTLRKTWALHLAGSDAKAATRTGVATLRSVHGTLHLTGTSAKPVPRIGKATLHGAQGTLHLTGEVHVPAPRIGTATLHVRTVQAVHVSAHYDNQVWRGVHTERANAYEAAAPLSSVKSGGYKNANHLKPVHGAYWVAPTHVRRGTSSVFKGAPRVRAAPRMVYEAATPLAGEKETQWAYPKALRFSNAARYEYAARVARSNREAWQYPGHLKPVKALRYEEATPQRRSTSVKTAPAIHLKKTWKAPWEYAKKAPYGKEAPYVPPPDVPVYTPNTALLFQCPWLAYAGNDILLNFGKYPCKEVEPQQPADTVIVPVKRVYMVINNVTLRRVDGNVELPTFSLSMSIDADSWTWGFNAALPTETLGAIEPGSDGTPVELEAVINGTAYRVLAEQISRDRTFGRSAIRVSGKGKSAILGAPYAPIQNFSNSQARTAQQLMNDALTINGASIGWTVNWGLTDWLVPTGAWAHQGTYITALNTIAGAAGGYIQPHPTQKQLNVLARYPTAPWNWGSLTPDFELPSDVTTREGIEWVERPRYNRIFVTGEGQGVLGQVTRAGTAGDILAPLVTDALITHSDAARQRGLSVLADSGRQAHLSLRLPVLAETGVIQPGKFVRYVDGGTTRIGIVRSTAVEVGMPEVWQTIGVETHVA